MPEAIDHAPADTRGDARAAHDRKAHGARRRDLRRRAWADARAGRWRQAIDLQRALLTLPEKGKAERPIRDLFRLLRWQLAAGLWGDILDTADGLYGRLARRGILGGTAAGWVFLCKAAAYFQLGQGARFRKTLAAVLRSSRHSPSSALRPAALRLGALDERLSREGDAPPGPCGRALRRTVAAHDHQRRGTGTGASAPDEQGESQLLGFLAGEIRCRPFVPLSAFRWDRFSAPLEGPPQLGSLLRRLERAHAMGTGQDPDAEESQAASAWMAAQDRVLSRWLSWAEERPGDLVPHWMVPALASLAEDHAPECDPVRRAALHRALARQSSRMAVSWARAIALMSLAEITLWLIPRAEGSGGIPAMERAVAQARSDLGLAAGLFRAMGWSVRAERCESRWARLALPSLGPQVAESAPAAASPEIGARPGLAGVQQSLAQVGFVTADRRLLRELTPLCLLATSPLPVLILGESGTGKEVLARALHRWSRLRGEFVPIHCGAIPRDLLESELFGHTRGAFTGASADKPGLIEAADAGSLFLDEIGEMGKDAQMKMLRVLESGEVRRLGDLHPRRAVIRLVAATHRDLEAEIERGAFRLDLFHRIRGIVVRLRPLRERRADIPLLASCVLSAAGGEPLLLPAESLACLLLHPWPGNVRELRAVLLRATHLARALGRTRISPEILGLGPVPEPSAWPQELEEIRSAPALGGSPAAAPENALATLPACGLEAAVDEYERRLILAALEENGWNRTRAARSLGDLSRTTLISKMKRLGIEGPSQTGVAVTDDGPDVPEEG